MESTRSAGFGVRNPFVSEQAVAFPNPFANAASDEVAEDAPEGSYTYALVKTAPDVPADEVETAVASVEIVVRWGSSVLSVSHLTPPRSFWLGEEERKNVSCDVFLPAEQLGATRAPLVLVDGSGKVELVLLSNAKGTVHLDGRNAMSVDQARRLPEARACAEATGAFAVPLTGRASLELGGIAIEVASVRAGKPVAASAPLDTNAAPYHGLSALAHIGMLVAAATFMPALDASASEDVSAEQRYLMAQYLNDAESARERDQEKAQDTQGSAEKSGGTGEAARGESGKMGSLTSNATNKRWAIERDPHNPDLRVSRAAALRDAAEFGLAGMLASPLAGSDPKGPISPWGDLTASGRDAISANGNMWGEDIGDAAGIGGLGLSGIGESGGGRGVGIGLGNVGTIGHGAGLGDGQSFGFGGSIGQKGPGHKPSAPSVRVANVTVGGRLPPEVIQRVVRQNFGRFRYCYEQGLRTSPTLSGRVAVRFVIGRDGSVSNVGNGGSDLPDSAVVSCIVRAFYGLSFPQPEEGGIVTVVYPIMLTPGS
jgi:hypothetical protein